MANYRTCTTFDSDSDFNSNSYSNLNLNLNYFISPRELLLSISFSTYIITLLGFYIGFKLIKYYNENYYLNYNLNYNQDNIPETLPERMAFYEASSELSSNDVRTNPFIVKLKGRNFKKYDINDKTFQNYMQFVGESLMREFHAQTSVIYSDEILLVFASDTDTPYHFNGNYTKLISSIASYAASILTAETNFDRCSFFANIITFPSFNKIDLINYIKYKSRYNTRQEDNSIIFIKREAYMDEQDIKYNYVKFTFDRIKANITHLTFFTDPSFVLDEINSNLKITFQRDLNTLEFSEYSLCNREFDCVCYSDSYDEIYYQVYGYTPRNAASRAYQYLKKNCYITSDDVATIEVSYKEFSFSYKVSEKLINDEDCHFKSMIIVNYNF